MKISKINQKRLNAARKTIRFIYMVHGPYPTDPCALEQLDEMNELIFRIKTNTY